MKEITKQERRQNRRLGEYVLDMRGQYARRPADDRPALIVNIDLQAEVRRQLGLPA